MKQANRFMFSYYGIMMIMMLRLNLLIQGHFFFKLFASTVAGWYDRFTFSFFLHSARAKLECNIYLRIKHLNLSILCRW